MKKNTSCRIIKLMILLYVILSYTAKGLDREPVRNRLFNTGWKFIRDSVIGAEKPEFDDSRWMKVERYEEWS